MTRSVAAGFETRRLLASVHDVVVDIVRIQVGLPRRGKQAIVAVTFVIQVRKLWRLDVLKRRIREQIHVAVDVKVDGRRRLFTERLQRRRRALCVVKARPRHESNHR